MKIVVQNLEETILCSTKRDVQLEHFIAGDVPTSRQRPELNSIIILPRSILKQLLGLFISAKDQTKIFTAFTICENLSGRNTEHRQLLELKMLMLRTYWETLMTKNWKKNWKRANTFRLTVRGRMRDTKSTQSHKTWILWTRKMYWKI